MLGLSLNLPGGALRLRLPAGAPTPTPAPPPAITTLLIEGDSITEFGGVGGFARSYGAYRSDRTVIVRSQNSRTVGGAAWAGPPNELADGGTPAGNTLLAHRPADLADGPQLVTTLIGANDLATFSAANYRARLIAWAGPIRAAGVKIGWSPPTPYWSEATPPNAADAHFAAERAALLATCRDPAVWGQWCDVLIPMGLHPDFEVPALKATLYGDAVHLSQAGHDRFLATYTAAVDTILDSTRANATTMVGGAWPASETNLTTSTAIVRRFMVRGVAPAGLALGASVAGGGAQLRLNGGAWGASVGTGSGNGHRLYNGDVIDLSITTAAASSTAVSCDLTVGSETRTLGFTTVANVTPVGYVHGDVEGMAPGFGATHLYAARAFASAGVALIGVAAETGPIAVKVDGVAATRRFTQGGGYGAITADAWTVPIAAAGAKDVELTFAASRKVSTISWGVVTGADPVPVAAPTDATAGADPHGPGAVTVPAQGLAIGFFGENAGGASVTPAVVASGTAIDEGQIAYQNEVTGLSVAMRSGSGALAWTFGYGPFPSGVTVFKAAGT